ncbi:tRNA lysidine(34) synthetase TilS [Achromobacter seleniivolatilans]|uniref:tRNA(Ile)-lysidine synthase n=1 Tax=Achromobacter seleniivolatilans TaxID=3047478 RepID=A0ABY9MA09_9BURK|nr:tRNA lysidine(34) synthetase TilS [Achromobacter sp. R39]WMD23871.1 tRNA lysidine(34) synthetase TilS [Achromobacter sp. R39]
MRGALSALPALPARVAVAISGGADSAMLAVHAAAVARELGIGLALFHVHHGLQDAADEWSRQVQALASLLSVPVFEARVDVAQASGKGIEAAAREARYAALAQLAGTHGTSHVLLAHHRNDQAETVLLRLLRGTGLAGMAAMAAVSQRDGVCYLRPWLTVDREAILEAANAVQAATGWRAVQDPTNSDPHYTRAALRELLAPVLDSRWPGWRGIVARHAGHMAQAAEILEEVAQEDFAQLDASPDGNSFSLQAWRSLSPARQAQVLRYWLERNGARMPTDARMRDLLRQLRELHSLGHDRQLRVEQAGHVIRCHRGRVWVEPREQGGRR